MKNLNEFISRLNEAGIKEGIDFIIENITHCEDGIKCTIDVHYDKNNTEKYHKTVLAVQGLIYHFVNSKRIKSDSYMYIMQNMHTIKFNLDK